MKMQIRSVTSAIWLILVSALVGWILFEFAVYSDLLVDSALAEASQSSVAPFGPDAVQVFRPSKYLLFTAIAVFGIGALIAQKRLIHIRAQKDNRIDLSRAGNEFANTAVIIALALAVWAALSVFLESFFEHGNAEVSVSLRLFNTYLPIILYTILVVSVLLSAFVFRQRVEPQKSEPALRPAEVKEAPVLDEPANVQRTIGLAFAIPIVAVAVALIFGLIVFDLTQTAIQVWIWVIIQIGIGGGIIAGTLFAQKAIAPYREHDVKPVGASIGAKNLNFVLSIIFAAVLSLMSLIYGLAAIEQLRVAPGLSMSVYSNQAKEVVNPEDELDLDQLFLLANGSDLRRNSAVTITLQSDADSVAEPTQLVVGDADREGTYWVEQPISASLGEGKYTLSISAMSADGVQLEQQLTFVVTDHRTSMWPEGTDTYAQDGQNVRVMPISIGWILSDLLPALLLLVLSTTSIYVTLRIRNSSHVKVAP